VCGEKGIQMARHKQVELGREEKEPVVGASGPSGCRTMSTDFLLPMQSTGIFRHKYMRTLMFILSICCYS